MRSFLFTLLLGMLIGVLGWYGISKTLAVKHPISPVAAPAVGIPFDGLEISAKPESPVFHTSDKQMLVRIRLHNISKATKMIRRVAGWNYYRLMLLNAHGNVIDYTKKMKKSVNRQPQPDGTVIFSMFTDEIPSGKSIDESEDLREWFIPLEKGDYYLVVMNTVDDYAEWDKGFAVAPPVKIVVQ